MKKKGRPSAWQQSAQWREISRAAISRWNARRPFLPKCGARRKRDGEPCQNLASANGKCRVHGGATPKADEWHRTQWPNGKAPDAERKLLAKLKRSERDQRRRDRRLAKMSPEEREAYDRWQRSHKPGSAAERARKRADRRAAADLRASTESAEARPVSPEVAALQAERMRLEAARDRLMRLLENQTDEGVFG